MLRLLKSLGYTPPNLKEYKKDNCEVFLDTNNNIYRLIVDGEEWMSYNVKEHEQAFELYSHYDLAKGHCICTGLGFGVRENWILNKKGVTKVTVLEKYKEVIDYHRFINPKFFDDVEVIHTDVYDYKGKCDTLLLDHYEWRSLDPNNDAKHSLLYLVLENSVKVFKNIECDTIWPWTLEHIVAGKSFQMSREVGSYVSKFLIYNDIKTHFGLHALPDLTEEELSLYYFMYNSKSVYLASMLCGLFDDVYDK